MSAIDILTGKEEGNFNQHEIDWTGISNSLNQLPTKPRPVVKQTIEKVVDRLTERITKSGYIPESFPIEANQVPIEAGSNYLASSLAETKQRLSLYNSLCEGMA